MSASASRGVALMAASEREREVLERAAPARAARADRVAGPPRLGYRRGAHEVDPKSAASPHVDRRPGAGNAGHTEDNVMRKGIECPFCPEPTILTILMGGGE